MAILRDSVPVTRRRRAPNSPLPIEDALAVDPTAPMLEDRVAYRYTDYTTEVGSPILVLPPWEGVPSRIIVVDLR